MRLADRLAKIEGRLANTSLRDLSDYQLDLLIYCFAEDGSTAKVDNLSEADLQEYNRALSISRRSRPPEPHSFESQEQVLADIASLQDGANDFEPTGFGDPARSGGQSCPA